MRVLLVTTGSRGDVDPFAALALALKGAGHTPTLAAPARFSGLGELYGIPFVALDDGLFDLQEQLAREGTFASLTGAAKAKPALRRFLFDVAGLAECPTDMVVHHPKTLAAPSVAEKQQVPCIAAHLIPLYQPTSTFPAPLVSHRIPSRLNRASWRIVAAVESPWRGLLREIHHDVLGLTTPLTSLAEHVRVGGALNAWSPHLLPAPQDWGAGAVPLGFWRLPSGGWDPPERLVNFLDAGQAPVHVGFGSMTTRDPAALGAAVREGLRRAGKRGIVVAGMGAIELDSTDDILVLDRVSHDWLFPRVSTVVHHGGVGTVAAALHAGVPQVIKPFLGDQPFWGRRLQEVQAGVLLGANFRRQFAEAIDRAATLAPHCRELARAMSVEDGTDAAIQVIESGPDAPAN